MKDIIEEKEEEVEAMAYHLNSGKYKEPLFSWARFVPILLLSFFASLNLVENVLPKGNIFGLWVIIAIVAHGVVTAFFNRVNNSNHRTMSKALERKRIELAKLRGQKGVRSHFDLTLKKYPSKGSKGVRTKSTN